MVVLVGRWSDGVQGCGVPHFWLRARGAAWRFLVARARCGVIILRIWESLLYGTAHFFVCARAVAAVPFLCARGAAVVWWIILRIWDIFLVAC